MSYLPSLVTIARDAGFDLELDGESVTIVAPRCPPSIEDVLEFHREAVVYELKRLELVATERLRGGPFDGCGDIPFLFIGQCYGKRVARAKWAVYEFAADYGCNFVGYAKSERKARQGDVYQTAEQSSALGVTGG